MNFRQIVMIYLKTIFRCQIIFLSFPLLVQNFKLQLFFWSQIKKKGPFSTEENLLFLIRSQDN